MKKVIKGYVCDEWGNYYGGRLISNAPLMAKKYVFGGFLRYQKATTGTCTCISNVQYFLVSLSHFSVSNINRFAERNSAFKDEGK